jgi:hypothetical protein
MNFTFWNAMIDIGFWTRLAKNKIELYKLDDGERPLIAKFRLTNRPEKFSIITVDAFSFDLGSEDKSGPIDFKVEGHFSNKNTIEDFKAVNPAQKDRTFADILRLAHRQTDQQFLPLRQRRTVEPLLRNLFADLRRPQKTSLQLSILLNCNSSQKLPGHSLAKIHRSLPVRSQDPTHPFHKQILRRKDISSVRSSE